MIGGLLSVMKLGLPTRVAPLPWMVSSSLIVVSQPPASAVASSTWIARPGVMLIVSASRLPLAWASAQAKLLVVALVP